MKALLVFLLILAYLSTLFMSTGHLAQWYALSLGDLPPWLAWGLAGSLEFSAFLLSPPLQLPPPGLGLGRGGALAALALVWLGNALSMHRAAPGVALWETLAMSLFVPVGTYVVGKVVGEMVAVRPTAERLFPPFGRSPNGGAPPFGPPFRGRKGSFGFPGRSFGRGSGRPNRGRTPVRPLPFATGSARWRGSAPSRWTWTNGGWSSSTPCVRRAGPSPFPNSPGERASPSPPWPES